MSDDQIIPGDYSIKYSSDARRTRNALPQLIQKTLLDVIDQLSDNPNGFPNRIRSIGRNGSIYIYSHPSPPLEITYELDVVKNVLYLVHFAAPVIELTKPIFISYSHKDTQWLTKLKLFLKPLERKDLIRVWDDTEIMPGSKWIDEIKNSLSTAKIAILLISQNFLSSEFINNEELLPVLKSAQEKGTLIFWVAISSSTVNDTPIAAYQAANDPDNPLDMLPEALQNRVLTDIYEKIKSVVENA